MYTTSREECILRQGKSVYYVKGRVYTTSREECILRQGKRVYYVKGGKTKFLDFFSYGHPQQKGLQGQEFSGMGAS